MVILQFPPEIFKLIDPKEFGICAATTFSVVVVSMDRPCTILESSCSFVSCRLVSSFGRAPVCWAGVREFKPRPDHQPKTGEIMLAVKPFSHFRGSRQWEVMLSRWPCLLHLCTSVGSGRKEPWHCSERVGDVRSDLMVCLTCAVIGLGGRGVIKTWTEVAARVCLYMLTSDLTSLVPPQLSLWLQVRKVCTANKYIF